jgi:membrane protein required for colicin V production
MNVLDVALVVLLLVCALRGFWRGFFRESFSFLGIVIGLAAALRESDRAADALGMHVFLPATARLGIAFVGIFIVVHTLLTVLGLVFDRLLGGMLLRQLNRAAGALFAAAKGGAILAFVLLFLHLFPVVPGLERRIMDSALARPMISMAGSVVRAGLRDQGPTPEGRV